jgi:hypothetical protein
MSFCRGFREVMGRSFSAGLSVVVKVNYSNLLTGCWWMSGSAIGCVITMLSSETQIPRDKPPIQPSPRQ